MSLINEIPFIPKYFINYLIQNESPLPDNKSAFLKNSLNTAQGG